MFGLPSTGEALDLASVGLGMAGTSFLDKKFLNPFAVKFLPSSGMVGEVVDAATTWVSASVLGWLVGMASSRFKAPIELGGKALAIGKLISVPVPGYHLDATLPISINGALALPAPGGAPAMGAAASGSAAPNVATSGVASNYPQPNQQFNVGF